MKSSDPMENQSSCMTLQNSTHNLEFCTPFFSSYDPLQIQAGLAPHYTIYRMPEEVSVDEMNPMIFWQLIWN